MSEFTLEIVEGPGAGSQVPLVRPIVIGRGLDADLRIEDEQISRQHARVSPTDGPFALVEDLESANGTFLNNGQVYGTARLDPSDVLLVGVTVIELRSNDQLGAQPTALRAVPPALAHAPRHPDFVDPEAIGVEDRSGFTSAGGRDLHKFLDVRVRRQAQLAPVALLTLIALALSIYFATR